MEIEEIIEQNPWWRIKSWYEFDKHLLMLKSSLFKIKRGKLKQEAVNLIYGPRQVGKTTLLKMMIKELIDGGTEPEKIAYFSCDSLTTNKREELRKAINSFLERGIKYLFIDEITNIVNWGYEIKYFIDGGKFEGLKVFITGSPFGMREHLPGRKLSYSYIMPLTFREFLINFSLNINDETKKAFNLNGGECEEIGEIARKFNSLSYNLSDLDSLKGCISRLEPHLSLLQKLFSSYLVVGGFPSVINGFIKYKTDSNRVHLIEEIKTSKERVIDSLRKAGKSEGICLQLINSIKKRVASRYSFTQLKETEIDLGKETIINYINHLRDIFLLKIVYAYDFGKEEIGWKKNKKIYLIDPFLYNEENILTGDFDDEYLSKIVESVTAMTLSYLKEDFLNPLQTFLFFWYNSQEIDFILNNEKLFAIEIKFRRKPEKGYKITQIKNYITLTKNFVGYGDEIFIPAAIFLSLLKSKSCYI